jgi:nucleoside-diphosphate-sugar epimerase
MIVVTGATGFLGHEVVRLLAREGGERLRCVVRPGTSAERLARLSALGPAVEPFPLRLEDPHRLAEALEGARVVYHLAAGKKGPPAVLVANTVVASEHVFQAAVEAGVGRLVLVSSFSTMAVAGLRRNEVVDERVPLEPHPELRDAYAFAKQRQERLAWRYAREHALPLVVVRPGFIFGPGEELLGSRIGLEAFGLFLHLGGRSLVPLTYVENCADAVVRAGRAAGAEGEVFCVVDDDLPTSAALLARYRREVRRLRVLRLPYRLLRQAARLNAWYSARTAGHLPPVFTPYKVDSLWRPQRYSNEKAKVLLGWRPAVAMDDALGRTFRALARPPAPVALPRPAAGTPAGGAARAEASA